MHPTTFRPVDPNRDFERLAEIFSLFESSPSTASGLRRWYQERFAGKYPFLAAVDAQDAPTALACLPRNGDPADGILDLTIIVSQALRGRGIGRTLYAEMEREAHRLGAQKMYAVVHDNDPASLAFMQRRGFTIRSQNVEMQLDLDALDDRRFDPLLARLQNEGFVFTSMAELGDTPEARRKLYELNSSSAMTTPGTDGRNPWANFEDFHSGVCKAEWYIPAGQKVVLDSHSGAWAGMSAITRFQGADHAYNLFTGVDPAYRNRGLGTAVKLTALRFARSTLDVHQVRTAHNAKNDPMIAIDLKLGYTYLPGMIGLVKALT
jgi:RimJ/RimL family protein N-acetyltransferase